MQIRFNTNTGEVLLRRFGRRTSIRAPHFSLGTAEPIYEIRQSPKFGC